MNIFLIQVRVNRFSLKHWDIHIAAKDIPGMLKHDFKGISKISLAKKYYSVEEEKITNDNFILSFCIKWCFLIHFLFHVALVVVVATAAVTQQLCYCLPV